MKIDPNIIAKNHNQEFVPMNKWEQLDRSELQLATHDYRPGYRPTTNQKTITNLFNRSQDHSSGCTTTLSGMHRYCLTPPIFLCSYNTQTCTDQRWNGYQNSVRIQDRRSMCRKNSKHYDLRRQAEKQTITDKRLGTGYVHTCIYRNIPQQ